MSKEELQVNFRMPASLKRELEALAKLNRRSLTAEVVARLAKSVEDDEAMLYPGLSEPDDAQSQAVRPAAGVSREKLMASMDPYSTGANGGDEVDESGLRVIKRNGTIVNYTDDALTRAIIRAFELVEGRKSTTQGPKPRKKYPK
jgi:hypothetical protein